MKDYGKYNNYFKQWVTNCDEATNIGSFLLELTPHDKDIFNRMLDDEINDLENETIKVNLLNPGIGITSLDLVRYKKVKSRIIAYTEEQNSKDKNK